MTPTHPELESFRQKFRVEELLIHRFEHWDWSVRPVHNTLGAGILSLRRYAAAFSDLTGEEAAELAGVTAAVEGALRKAFGYEKINYLMLMMVDPHVHFHVLPRYSAPVSFAGREWPDASWPGLPQLAGETAPVDVLHEVQQRLKTCLAE